MTTEQPEALQLADDLDAEAGRITQYTNSRGDLLRELAAAELRRQHAEIETLRTGYDAVRLDIDSLRAINLELERVCEATYVAQGADAYHHACSLMERHQKERAAAGKVVGTERSLCDGLSWLYGHIAGLESQLEAAQLEIEGLQLRDAERHGHYGAALLEIASLQAQLESIGAGGVEPLRKRECLHQISEPDHFRGATKMVAEAEHFEREWYLRGDALEAALSATLTPLGQAQDAQRYRWLRDNRSWQVLHRIRPGKSIEYRMRDDGDWWGSWWPTHEQAIDAAIAAQQGGTNG